MGAAPRLAVTLGALLLLCPAWAPADETSAPASSTRPWTRWWWPGSAVDEAGITRQLEQLSAAGIGGVEVTPIYGARGYEDRYVEFLSPRFVALLEHAAREARRLGLGLDMATGTGWPFGGPWVETGDAARKPVLRGGRLAGEPTGQKVKRAAPGGEGLVLDPYSPDALRRYLARFDEALAPLPRGLVRGQFHDSFEYYGAGWTPGLADRFRALHGYDLEDFASALVGESTLDRDTLARVKSDYREAIASLHLEYVRAWADWCHAHGFLARNQAHGAPANLLDVYAAADIPETETFGSAPFPIPGLRRNPDEVRPDHHPPESLVIRMASSAAHVAGRPLASSESLTWLRDHWKVALSHAKPELDRLFAHGINHVVYHGTVYSPPEVPWPGWLFYASTQFNPSNPWWDDFAELNRYVARVQEVLQAGRPDDEVLLYWPAFDVWDDPEGLVRQLAVADTRWLTEAPVGELARRLLASGYAFDYVSDAQLLATKVEGGSLVTPGASYRVLVVPRVRRMPVATLRHLVGLARDGAAVVLEALPEDVPGLGRLEERRRERRGLIDELAKLRGASGGPGSAPARVVRSADPVEVLRALGVRREPIADRGIVFNRRATADGHAYFFANLTAEPVDGWVPIGVPARAAVLLDPLTGRRGSAALRRTGGGRATEVFLQLAPGESLILLAGESGEVGERWRHLAAAGPPVPVEGEWSIEFVKGGPALPPPLKTRALRSWTELGGEDAARFAGTARYRIGLERPAAPADEWVLDLGDVRESARVRVNGELVATAWSVPLRVRLGEHLRPGRNELELEVTSLAANRIRDLDRRGVPWKIMREINFVDIRYQPFDASAWDVAPSGLLGPVRLLPMAAFSPE